MLGNILQFRVYMDGHFTLDGEDVELHKLDEPIRAAASSGGVAWIWAQSDDLSAAPQVDNVMRELAKVNLRFGFAEDEDFSGIPLSENEDAVRPSNVLLYNTEEEIRQYAGNETELFVYLSNLQLRFDSYFVDIDDSGIFHIVCALRTGASKIWFLHPGLHGDEFYQPLVEFLESQPLPTVKDGVLAFLISIKRPFVSRENPQFDVVAPDEWTDVSKRLQKDMRLSEILDVVWPAETR